MPYIGKTPASVPVTSDDIPNNSITSAKILDNVITIADIGPNAVGSSEMADDAVGLNELSAGGTTNVYTVLGGTAHWAVPPNTVYTHPNHSGDVTSTADGATVIGNNKVITDKILNSNVTTAKIADDAVTAAKLANSINTDIATGVTGNTTANAALAKSGGTMTGNIAHAGAFTLDAGGDIHLDTGGQTKFDKNGTNYGIIFNSSNNLGIHVGAQDKDLVISGNDGGSTITALTLDMSDGGAATFNSYIDLQGNNLYIADNAKALFGTGEDLHIYHENTNHHSYIWEKGSGDLYLRGTDVRIKSNTDNDDMATFIENGAASLFYSNAAKIATSNTGVTVTGNIANASGAFTLDVGGDLLLDSDGGNWRFNDGGTGIGLLKNSSSDFQIEAKVQDKDIKFVGNDGGSAVTALTLDMSAAGAATFNASIALAGDIYLANNSILRSGGEALIARYDPVIEIGSGDGNDYLKFKAGAAERMRITTGGNVGIGVVPSSTWTSSIEALTIGNPKFSLYGDSANSFMTNNVIAASSDERYATGKASLYVQTDGNHEFKTAASGSAGANISWITQFQINQNGEVLKGPWAANGSNTGTKFINGEMHSSYNGAAPRKQIYIYNPNGEVGSIASSFTSCVFNTSSDYRLKENVDYTWDATTRLKQLKPARFNFIAHAERTVDGFLAHEAATVVPEAVTGLKDAMKDEEYEITPAVIDGHTVVTEAVMGTRSVPDMQGIDQSKLVPLMVKTIQELEARITALEA